MMPEYAVVIGDQEPVGPLGIVVDRLPQTGGRSRGRRRGLEPAHWGGERGVNTAMLCSRMELRLGSLQSWT